MCSDDELLLLLHVLFRSSVRHIKLSRLRATLTAVTVGCGVQVANRFLVAMGGNDGKATLGDAWALDTSEKPYQWRKITECKDMPSARCGAVGHPSRD